MKPFVLGVLTAACVVLSACTTTKQHATADFKPPEGNYKLIVMRPEVQVSVLTAGGLLEPREDWTEQARANLLAALQAQQAKRGGTAKIAATRLDAGGDPQVVEELDRLHSVVGQAIKWHKYTPGAELPTKQHKFDWTLGESAVIYGRSSGYDYALFLYAADSFSSGGRIALQAVSMLGCVVGVCIVPAGGSQRAFVSLVDLKTGQVVWYNFLFSEDGDIRTPKGANEMVELLLEDMKPGKSPKKTG